MNITKKSWETRESIFCKVENAMYSFSWYIAYAASHLHLYTFGSFGPSRYPSYSHVFPLGRKLYFNVKIKVHYALLFYSFFFPEEAISLWWWKSSLFSNECWPWRLVGINNVFQAFSKIIQRWCLKISCFLFLIIQNSFLILIIENS